MIAHDEASVSGMQGSPLISDRTWCGLARCDMSGVVIEGALEPWSDSHDKAQLLLIDELGPIGWLILEPKDLNETSVTEHLKSLGSCDRRQSLPELPNGELTIAVCTRERPESLRSCLERIRLGVDNRHEVLVVDNAPVSDGTERVVDELAQDGMRIRRVVEGAPGLSRARNLALREANTEYLAYTDDDTLPDVGWSTALLRGFSAGTNVALVTGIVPPAQIETRAQALFEKKLKWSTNLLPETYSMVKRDNYSFPFPYSAGHFGAGANFAVRRKTVSDLGGFDEALGAGTHTEGGEDTEMFVRIIRAGYELSYEPSAIVWHVHRREDDLLRKHLYGYGKGLSAGALSEFLHPGKIEMVRGCVRGALNLSRERRAEVDYGMPRHHLALELAGVLCGPFAYLWERRRTVKST
jgi:GT2 family glycosyltransferase